MPFTYVVNVYSDMLLSKGLLGSWGGGGGKALKHISLLTMHILLLNYTNFKNIRAI